RDRGALFDARNWRTLRRPLTGESPEQQKAVRAAMVGARTLRRSGPRKLAPEFRSEQTEPVPTVSACSSVAAGSIVSRRLAGRGQNAQEWRSVEAEEQEGRERQAALQQALRREVNERRWGGRSEAEVVELVCECSEPSCDEVVLLSCDEYEFIRRVPIRLIVRPDHVQ